MGFSSVATLFQVSVSICWKLYLRRGEVAVPKLSLDLVVAYVRVVLNSCVLLGGLVLRIPRQDKTDPKYSRNVIRDDERTAFKVETDAQPLSGRSV